MKIKIEYPESIEIELEKVNVILEANAAGRATITTKEKRGDRYDNNG